MPFHSYTDNAIRRAAENRARHHQLGRLTHTHTNSGGATFENYEGHSHSTEVIHHGRDALVHMKPRYANGPAPGAHAANAARIASRRDLGQLVARADLGKGWTCHVFQNGTHTTKVRHKDNEVLITTQQHRTAG